MHLLAIHCKNLQVVRCKDFKLKSAFKELLWCNANITEIWLHSIHVSGPILFEKVPLSKLSTLSIRNSLCERSFPLPTTSVSNTLQKLQLGLRVHSEILLRIVNLSPALKSLSLKGVQLTNKVLINVCSVQSTVQYLDVSNNLILNSDGVLGMVRNLTTLRSMSIQSCPLVADRSIHNIASQYGNTLEVLYLDVKLVCDTHMI